MTSRLDEISKQVFDDAYELLRTAALVEPLIQQEYLTRIHHNQLDIAIFLRMQLARQVILLATKLHENVSSGSTGETASIISLLDECLTSDILSSADFGNAMAKLDQMKQAMEARGLKFGELKRFRHAEIAHSLHALKVILPDPMYHVIGEFAHDTIEFCFDLQRRLKSSGITAQHDLESKFDIWRGKGENFWSALSLPDNESIL